MGRGWNRLFPWLPFFHFLRYAVGGSRCRASSRNPHCYAALLASAVGTATPVPPSFSRYAIEGSHRQGAAPFYTVLSAPTAGTASPAFSFSPLRSWSFLCRAFSRSRHCCTLLLASTAETGNSHSARLVARPSCLAFPPRYGFPRTLRLRHSAQSRAKNRSPRSVGHPARFLPK